MEKLRGVVETLDPLKNFTSVQPTNLVRLRETILRKRTRRILIPSKMTRKLFLNCKNFRRYEKSIDHDRLFGGTLSQRISLLSVNKTSA